MSEENPFNKSRKRKRSFTAFLLLLASLIPGLPKQPMQSTSASESKPDPLPPVADIQVATPHMPLPFGLDDVAESLQNYPGFTRIFQLTSLIYTLAITLLSFAEWVKKEKASLSMKVNIEGLDKCVKSNLPIDTYMKSKAEIKILSFLDVIQSMVNPERKKAEEQARKLIEEGKKQYEECLEAMNHKILEWLKENNSEFPQETVTLIKTFLNDISNPQSDFTVLMTNLYEIQGSIDRAKRII